MSRGWILGFQAPLDNGMFRSAEAFALRLRALLAEARAAVPQAWEPGVPRLLVFPECLAAWLVFAGGPEEQYAAEVDLAQAGLLLAQRSFHDVGLARRHPELLQRLVEAPDSLEASRLVLALHGERAAREAHRAWSALACEADAWLVGGSLYAPRLDPAGDGEVSLAPAEELALFSQAPIYDPAGRLVAVGRKAWPTHAEAFLTPAPPEPACLDTALGRAGVMVCADSWYAPSYEHLARERAELLLVPCYGDDQARWHEPWQGFQGDPGEADREAARVARLDPGFREADAWARFALLGRFATVPSARIGMNVFAVGQVWGRQVGGESLAVWREGEAVRSLSAGTPREPALLAVRLEDGGVAAWVAPLRASV